MEEDSRWGSSFEGVGGSQVRQEKKATFAFYRSSPLVLFPNS